MYLLKLKVAAIAVFLSAVFVFANSFCMNCGIQLIEGANFCGGCGRAAGGGGTTEMQTPLERQTERHAPIHEIGFSEQLRAGNTILEIHKFEDFMEFQTMLIMQKQRFEGKEIRLMADIDISERDIFGAGRSQTVFSGKFDGNRYSIIGLNGGPLFSSIKNAVIQNLSISASSFRQASIAYESRNSTVSNVNVSADVEGGGSGGLFTKVYRTTIRNSSFDGNVRGTSLSSTGGIVSVARRSSILSDNNVSGSISGKVRKTDGVGFTSLSSSATGNNVNAAIKERPRLIFAPELGYSFGLGDYGISSYDFSGLFGVIINRNFSIGLGFGGHMITSQKTNGIRYDTYGNNSEQSRWDVVEKVIMSAAWNGNEILIYDPEEVVPSIYLRPRYCFSGNNVSAIIDAGIGLAQGFYFNPSFGVVINRFHISLGYKMHALEYQRFLPKTERVWYLGDLIDLITVENTGSVRKINNSLTLKFGIDLGYGQW